VRSQRLVRPQLEVLEDRCVPSTVMNLNDAGDGSLRQAILDTPAGGTVDFQPGLSGTITLTSGELAISSDLTIAGPGASVLTVSGNHASRVFDITATSHVALSGLTVADGTFVATPGGGIYNVGTLTVTDCTIRDNTTFGEGGGIDNVGTLTLTNSTLSGNSAFLGGGIYNAGTVTLTSSTFSGNSAPRGDGGGVDNEGPGCVISGCDFHNNRAEFDGAAIINNRHPLEIHHTDIGFNSAGASGGGIFDRLGGSLTIDACSIHDNSAVTYGGGLNIGAYVTGEITCTITNTDFVHNRAEFGGGIHEIVIVFNLSRVRLLDNSATIYGGGLLLENGDSHLSQCVIEGNSAPYAGAGLYYDGAEQLGNTSAVLDQCLIDNNHATASSQYPGDGGGVCFSGGMYFGAASELDIRNSTVSGNTASGVGGGILWRSGQYRTRLLVEDSTVAFNQAQTGGGLYSEPHYPFTTPPDVHSSIIADNTAAGAADVFGPAHSLGYNLVQAPSSSSGWTGSDLLGVDPLLGPLQDNGGPTWTHALLGGSPAIGAGDLSGAPDFDQRGPGFPRVVNGTIDIGAFEVQAAPGVVSVVVNDGSAQRSLVTSLTVTFSGVVSFNPGAFEVQQQGGGLIQVDVSAAVSGNETVAVLTFAGAGIINGSLPDGDYTLTLLADHVHDPSGQTLAADSVTSFFRLFGDINGNGVIDVQDLLRFASTFGKSAGDAGYLGYFDYYGTGRVDFSDLIQLLLRIGKRV
jgi:hypothetical protein